jgi:Cu-Zn family superoxide dismutase
MSAAQIKKEEGMTMKKIIVVMLLVLLFEGAAFAEDILITVHAVNEQGLGEEIGTVTASDSAYGLILTPTLSHLTPGLHGFHIHEKPDCSVATKDGKPVSALAAGGHYDPGTTGKHEGPYGNGHLGDLPALYVAADGKASLPILAPRLKAADLRGRSVIIHAGGDNYSDMPAPLGGGGARVACGVVK